ncbi:MAG: sigma-70 family RNA polymerase sigma factor [Planctomycetes bacterium]|nr:sigma-70 family RNA polymerase sigma factor [Planctomycetota bacterium]
MAEITDEQLIDLFRGGDAHAFTQLVKRYEKELYNFLLRFVGRGSMAEDIFQETFLQVHISVDTLQSNRRFRPWLYTIASNKARDHLRSKARRPTVQITGAEDDEDTGNIWDYLTTEETTAEDILMKKQQKDMVRRVVDQLPDHLRQILILAYFSQLSYQEMAEVLEIPLGTVKSRLHSAVANFGRLFNEHNEPEERN